MAAGILDKRAMILAAAREFFERFGYRRTVIDNVVREAGVAKGTFYLYFESKEELFLEVVKAMRAEIMQEYYEKISKETSALGKIRITLRFSLEAFDDYPLLARLDINDEEYRLMMSLLAHLDVKQELDRTLAFLKDLFRQGVVDGSVRADIDLDSMPIVFGSLKFMHFSFESIHKATGITKERFIDSVVDLAVKGIAADGGEK